MENNTITFKALKIMKFILQLLCQKKPCRGDELYDYLNFLFCCRITLIILAQDINNGLLVDFVCTKKNK